MESKRHPEKISALMTANFSSGRSRHNSHASTGDLNSSTDVNSSRLSKAKTTPSHRSRSTEASQLPPDLESASFQGSISPPYGEAGADSNFDTLSLLPSQPSPTEGDENRKRLTGDNQIVLHYSEEETHSCWSFELPKLKSGQFNGQEVSFNNKMLTRALQHGATAEEVEEYMHRCNSTAEGEEMMKQYLNQPVEGFTPMFYAVETNDKQIVQVIARYGGRVNQTVQVNCHYRHRVPLLGFAIIRSTKNIVAILLSLGAKANDIPKVFYDPYLEDFQVGGPTKGEINDFRENNKQWSQSNATRRRLWEALDLTQRYHLHRSTVIEPPTNRGLELTSSHNAHSLWEIPYLLVGQVPAVTSVTDALLVHLAIGGEKPLVLVFAGPSGHGKTELARSLGDLLQVEHHTVDCTTETSVTDIFGPKPGYYASARGSRLNNFLVQNDNKRAIVFLDEFEKTTEEVQNVFLIPFEKGEYNDRRDQQPPRTINCSQIIWIMATNALDEDIKKFWNGNKASLEQANPNINQKKILLNRLSKIMTSKLKIVLGSPLTSRIDEIIPFLPFEAEEQAVGVHKYIAQLKERIHRPGSSSGAVEGNGIRVSGVRLHVLDEASVCKHLASENYDADLGMRSLQKAVSEQVERKVTRAWLKSTRATSAEEVYALKLEGGDIEVQLRTQP